MKARTLALVALAATLVGVTGSTVGSANDIVEIRLRGRYYAEPATVQVTVAVEPNADNRVLRIEVDGDRMYRSSEITLAGADEKRIHTIQFKNLTAGEYVLSAQVYSDTEMRAVASQGLSVSGMGMR